MWLTHPNLILILATVIAIWLSALSFYLFKVVSHYKNLVRGAQNIGLDKILERINQKLDHQTESLAQISALQIAMQQKSQDFLQKVALLRFNPFEDAGGDQSFVVALLNSQGTGIVVSSLHSRSGTRIYAKAVLGGKAQTHSLTREEKETIDKALKKKIN